MERIKIAGIFADSEQLSGKSVVVCGWARTIRDMKKGGNSAPAEEEEVPPGDSLAGSQVSYTLPPVLIQKHGRQRFSSNAK